MMTILNTIVIGLMLVTTTAQSPDCRPSIQFYHIAHGAISARIDELVLNGAYKITYIVRQKIHPSNLSNYLIAIFQHYIKREK